MGTSAPGLSVDAADACSSPAAGGSTIALTGVHATRLVW